MLEILKNVEKMNKQILENQLLIIGGLYGNSRRIKKYVNTKKLLKGEQEDETDD